MKDCFAYIRVSTVKQSKHGVSLQEQRSAILAYAQKNNFNITQWFEETVTAAKCGRPKFVEMMDRLADKEVNAVIIHKIDRSARNLRDWVDLGELSDAGVEFHFAIESLDLNTRGGRLAADIQAVVAADFIRNLRMEAHKGFIGRLKQGLYPLRAPIGYLDQGGGKPKIPDPRCADTIKRAFKLYATGEYSIRTLQKKLQLKNGKGTPISINGWSTILNNSFYYGEICISTTNDIYKGIHQPLISKALYDRVRKVLSGKCGQKETKHSYLFKRMFSCVGCGYAMIGERQKGNVYYRCHTKDCVTKGFREEFIEETVQEFLYSCALHRQLQKPLTDKIEKYIAEMTIDTTAQETGLKLNLQKVTARLSRLTSAYLEGIVDENEFKKTKVHDALEKERFEREIEEISRNPAMQTARLRYFLERIKTLVYTYEIGNHTQKRRLLKQVTSNRTILGKNVELEASMPWGRIRKIQSPLYCEQQRSVTRTEIEKIVGQLFDVILKHISQNISQEYIQTPTEKK